MSRTHDGLFGHQLNRRALLGMFGGTAAMAGAAALGRSALAMGGGTGRRAVHRMQDGTPPPMQAPALGPQADGTNMWRVRVGSMAMEPIGIEYQAFLPGDITINAGDAIWFDTSMPGFHTITFLGGGEVPPIFVPDETATPEAGVTPNQLINPAIVLPTQTFAVDATTYVNSGVTVFGDPTQPIIFTFPVEGTFDYLCIPHQAVMTGKVTVQAKGSALPMDQAAVDKAGDDQLAAIVQAGADEVAKYNVPATSTDNADGSKTWSAVAGAGGMTQARVQAFFPPVLEIKAGDTVTWTNMAPGEPHTISFLGADTAPPEDVIVVPSEAGPPKVVQNNLTFLPQGDNVFSNKGFVNSGWIGFAPGFPADWSCKFDTAGEYTYYCVLHGGPDGSGMAAKLKVS